VQYFQDAKKRIAAFMSGYLDDMADRYSFIERWGRDAVERLHAFCSRGKMIRGGLVLLGHGLCGGSRESDALRCAAAMELFQSAFLVHDDIMDRDRTRRGEPSLFWQYAALAEREGLADPYHQGESLGICGGDIAFFLGFDLLSVDDPPPGFLSFCSREIITVGLAQMRDVFSGAGGEIPSEREILDLYRYKTGRYSFSLPLMAGAMLAGKGLAELEGLSRLGELMGMAFQIRDDELGMFGDERDLGKPVGSDLREGKKTLLIRALLDSLPEGERGRIASYVGSSGSCEAEMREIRELFDSRGGRERLASILAGMSREADDALGALDYGDGEHKRALKDLLDFTTSRKF